MKFIRFIQDHLFGIVVSTTDCHLRGSRFDSQLIIISVVPKGRSFTAHSGTKAAVLPKGRISTANSGTKVAVLLGINRCGSFPLLYAPLSLFSI